MERIESQVLYDVQWELLPGKVDTCTPRAALREFLETALIDIIMDKTDRTVTKNVRQILRSDGTMTILTTKFLKPDALLRSITDFIRACISEATKNLIPTICVQIYTKT